MIGLVFVWTVGFSFSTIFQCFPFSVNWSPDGGGNVAGKCIDVNRMLMATAWSDVITNVVIILLPLGCVGFSGHPCIKMTNALLDLGAQDAILEKDRRVQCVSSWGFVSR